MAASPPPRAATIRAAKRLRERLLAEPTLRGHPQHSDLVHIVTGPTAESSAGFPYLCQSGFATLVEQVPHLFQDGERLLQWLDALDRRVGEAPDMGSEEKESLASAAKVLRNVVLTAIITAPPDLWLLRHVLGAHDRLGLLGRWRRGEALRPDLLARDQGLDERQLRIDAHLLLARGYLIEDEGGFRATGRPQTREIFEAWPDLPGLRHAGAVERLAEALRRPQPSRTDELSTLFRLSAPEGPSTDWVATRRHIEIGHRLLLLVLALHESGGLPLLLEGASLNEAAPGAPHEVHVLGREAGVLQAGGRLSVLGERAFRKGPGPYGIIQAYEPYMVELDGILQGTVPPVGVNRKGNVAASQEANRQTFELANRALDAFCQDTGFRYDVFVEHAVGQGEALRQRFLHDGERVALFGADLEDAAIDAAIAQQAKGRLPAAIRWIRRADIGKPQVLIEALRAAGRSPEGAVMMVGNGFHEVRDQANERMIDVFRGYEEAGLLLVFTEESALSDADLLATAWNTYHAGFRYVHEMSGQGLRPASQDPYDPLRLSWRACAERGGYVRLEKYSYRTRTIFPFPREDGHNPSISVSHFCVPRRLWARLGAGSPPAG